VHEATRTLFWFDEIFTLWTVRLGLHGALDLLRHDMHPPLFFLLVAGWRAIGGEGEVWLRLVPIAFGVVMVWAAYALGRDLFGRPAGLLAALLVALHPRMVYHSRSCARSRCCGRCSWSRCGARGAGCERGIRVMRWATCSRAVPRSTRTISRG
jgi:predicted membrane-bound mannosyltransferase